MRRNHHAHTTRKTPVEIALLWHSPSAGNLGIGALTLANIQMIREIAAKQDRQVNFVIIGYTKGGQAYPQMTGIKTIHVQRSTLIDPRIVFSSLRRCDLVIDIGAGDSFSDIYGMRRFMLLALTKIMTLAAQTPLVLAPQTIGPFKSKMAKFLAEFLIARSSSAFARDQISLAAINSRKAREKIQVTSDLAFMLDYQARPTTQQPKVGLNISALLVNGGYTGKNQFELKLDYKVFVERLIAHFQQIENIQLILLPHVFAPLQQAEDDLFVSRQFAYAHGLPEPSVFTDPSDAKSIISSCDFVIAARMHASIAAVSSGVATAPIAYSRKFSGLYESIGYPYTVDARSLTTDQALDAVIGLFHKRDEIKSEAKAAAGRARGALSKYTDTIDALISRY